MKNGDGLISNVIDFEEYKLKRNIKPYDFGKIKNYSAFIINIKILNEVSDVIDRIKNGEIVFANIDNLNKNDKDRFYCILCGACKGLDVVFLSISNGVYIAGNCEVNSKDKEKFLTVL